MVLEDFPSPPPLAQPQPRRPAGAVSEEEDAVPMAGSPLPRAPSHDGNSISLSGFEYRRSSIYSSSSPPPNVDRSGSPHRAASPTSPAQLVYNVPPLPRSPKAASFNLSPKRNASPLLPAAPASPTLLDLSGFEESCRQFYFEDDVDSRNMMEHALDKAPQSHRPTYMRLQAKVRQQYHDHMAREGRIRLAREVENAIPCSKLPDHGQSPRSATDRRARLNLLTDFVTSHCTSIQIGSRPFFGALRLLLLYQARGIERGGAGEHQAIWAFDEAVLLEAGGTEFERSAIDTLVGVLGFEVITPKRQTEAQDMAPNQDDPFANGGVSLSLSRASLSNSPHKSSPLAMQSFANVQQQQQQPLELALPSEREPFYRLWKIPPYITDPECRQLASLIPESILPNMYRDIFTDAAQVSRKTVAQKIDEAAEEGRSPYESDATLAREVTTRMTSSVLPADDAAVGLIQLPTGWAWRSEDTRETDFKGGLFSRFLGLLKRALFGL